MLTSSHSTQSISSQHFSYFHENSIWAIFMRTSKQTINISQAINQIYKWSIYQPELDNFINLTAMLRWMFNLCCNWICRWFYGTVLSCETNLVKYKFDKFLFLESSRKHGKRATNQRNVDTKSKIRNRNIRLSTVQSMFSVTFIFHQ